MGRRILNLTSLFLRFTPECSIFLTCISNKRDILLYLHFTTDIIGTYILYKRWISMINDRGTKKWTSIMMPEQINMLDKMWEELEWKDKPELDEQQIEENGMKLQLAIKNKLTVEVKYFHEHDFHTIRGKILDITSSHTLIFDDEERTRIDFNDVVNVIVE